MPMPGSNGRRPGRFATSASNTCRPACSTSSMRTSTRIRTAARPATPARRPSFRASSSWSNAMPMRSGGTTACSARKSTSASSTIPISATSGPVRRLRAEDLGARRHQRSRRADLCRDHALDAGRQGEHRVRLRRAFRPPHRHAALADGAQPVPVDQRDRRRRHARRQVDARRHNAAEVWRTIRS